MTENEKFLDISPPHKIDRQGLKRIKPRRPSKSFLNKKIFLTVFLFLIIGGTLFYFKSQKAEIKIWPETETVKIEKEITIKEGAILSFSSQVLPAVALKTESEESQKFPASYVSQEKKAEGTIRVYNFYSTTSLVLRAQTRFLSDGGKLFRAPERIVVPGKKLEKGKWLAGILDVKVVAAEPGDSYNIPPSKFSLPGLAGTNLYTLVYGESKEAMKGGFSGKGNQILAEDLEIAEDILTAKIEKANIETLRQKAAEQEQILLEETISHQVIEAVSSERVGENIEEFEFRAKLETNVLSFKKESLERFSKELINAQISEDEIFWPETLELNWQTKESDLEKGEISLSLEISAKISDKIEKSALVDTLAGKSMSEALFLLKNQFEKVEIKISPFWLKRIPKDPQKIELEFILAP